MKITLETISFNYDSKLENTGAFNVRRNETMVVTLPEWRDDRCSNPECSPAAYAISRIPNTVTIQASFICDDVLAKSVRVQALSVPPATNILGDIPDHEIPLNSGRSGNVILRLTNAVIRDSAIGATNISWRWQFSQDSVNWTDFQTTKHRIYTVLALPTEPWEPECRNPSNIHLPWTEVLDLACSWALGVKKDPNLAAAQLTSQVYALGEHLVKYQFGASYANAKFACTKFLNLLNTGIGGNQTVNCDDCATIISTFANILGCDLFQSGMGLSFDTNPIRLIGYPNWKPTNFLYHSVAWQFPCGANNTLFDSCLQVDGDSKPSCRPHEPLQPAQILFGNGRDDAYHFRLVDAKSACVPIPTDGLYGRQRRKLGQSYLADREIKSEALLSLLKRLYAFDTWPQPPGEADDKSVESTVDLFIRDVNIENWKLHTYEHLQNSKLTNIFLTLYTRIEGPPTELLAMNLYQCSALTNPNDFLVQVLSSFEQLLLQRLPSPSIGDVGFHETNDVTVLFRRNRFVAVVRSAGRQSLSVVEVAKELDQYLLRFVTVDRE
jgi:hypothetical protein